MMDWTDSHCRYFLRGFSPDVLLYTEMINAEAILRGEPQRLLRFNSEEHPVALQLGGSEPARLAAAARIGAAAGYDEINLNCGCPSDRVHAGAFGACLMAEPTRVADCVRAMREAVPVPVTVKMRIGIVQGHGAEARQRGAGYDEADYAALRAFTAAIVAAGCEAIIVHARKAVLGGLSPQENRTVPPLRYDIVQRLQGDFPQVPLVLNGGLRTSDEVEQALGWCDGVMLGREAYHRPQLLAELSERLHGVAVPDDATLLNRMTGYAERELAAGESLPGIVRHMLGMFAGRPGAREFRRLLSEGARETGADASLLLEAAQRAGVLGSPKQSLATGT